VPGGASGGLALSATPALAIARRAAARRPHRPATSRRRRARPCGDVPEPVDDLWLPFQHHHRVVVEGRHPDDEHAEHQPDGHRRVEVDEQGRDDPSREDVGWHELHQRSRRVMARDPEPGRRPPDPVRHRQHQRGGQRPGGMPLQSGGVDEAHDLTARSTATVDRTSAARGEQCRDRAPPRQAPS
jgi:hypothetical protein